MLGQTLGLVYLFFDQMFLELNHNYFKGGKYIIGAETQVLHHVGSDIENV